MILVNQRDDSEQRRLSWRCRRGMLELDIVLKHFITMQFNTLNLAELQAFDALLALPDNDFWALLSGSAVDVKDKHTRVVVTKIKEQKA
jgi:antitoxin CptB